MLLQTNLPTNVEDEIIDVVKSLCLKKPANEFLKELGE